LAHRSTSPSALLSTASQVEHIVPSNAKALITLAAGARDVIGDAISLYRLISQSGELALFFSTVMVEVSRDDIT
jgi:hypothetical protein